MHQLAQINIGRMRGVNINDPIMKEFVDNLEMVNNLAESSPGFIWRLKVDNNNATNFNPFNDDQVIINVSVWASINELEQFVFRTLHTDFLRRRKEWFQAFGKVYTGMWWIPARRFPSVQDSIEKLKYLQSNGPTQTVFNFKTKFPQPSDKTATTGGFAG